MVSVLYFLFSLFSWPTCPLIIVCGDVSAYSLAFVSFNVAGLLVCGLPPLLVSRMGFNEHAWDPSGDKVRIKGYPALYFLVMAVSRHIEVQKANGAIGVKIPKILSLVKADVFNGNGDGGKFGQVRATSYITKLGAAMVCFVKRSGFGLF